MNCKKGYEYSASCLCMKRKHGDCTDCEKKAINIIQKTGKDLNEVIRTVKESGKVEYDLYVGVNDGSEFMLRSAVDILRGVCRYCKRLPSKTCLDCMWLYGLEGEDLWVFNDDA